MIKKKIKKFLIFYYKNLNNFKNKINKKNFAKNYGKYTKNC